VRRLQQLLGVLLAAAMCGPYAAVAQAQPAPQPASDQAPVEQTQPAATSPGTGQAPPATTPPAGDEQQGPPPAAPPPGPPAQGAQSQGAPPQNQAKPAARSESGTSAAEASKGEGTRSGAPKGEGAGAKGEPGKAEANRSEAQKGEAGAKGEARGEGKSAQGEGGARVEGKAAQGEAGARGEGKAAQGEGGARGEGKAAQGEGGARGETKAAQGEGGQGGTTQPRHARPANAEAAAQAGQTPAAGGAAGAAQQQAGQAGAAQAGAAQAGAAGAKPAAPRQPAAPPFSFAAVEKIAQERSSKPYRNRSTKLPDAIAKLTFEQYRDIRFQRTSSLWYDKALFEVQFFHRGFNFDRRVNISEVSGGVARPVLYNPAMFDFGPRVPKIEFPADLGFAGFRIHYPLNTPAYKDELIVFLGASYFRVLGRNQTYGLSARGLAIDTGSTSGEEFPYFTDFWLVKPDPGARTMTVYALLDSPGITGAYQFEVRPGATTQVQVTAELYPRRQIGKLGIAPLTSMFLYGENSGAHRFDDFRPEVHDTDGLMTERGTGEWMWRPLVNPKELRVNRFMDEHPRGFGLVQRDRDFNHYQDNEARYERRPSYRVEPLGDWGKGGVELVEIPSDEEIHDNIVAFWVPDAPVQPQKPMTFSYLLSAYTGTTQWPPGGKVIATHFSRVISGTNVVAGARRVIVDFAGGDLDTLAGSQPVQAAASASGGEIDDVSVERLAANGVWRVSMRVKTSDKPVDLRCYLTLYGEALTETWTYLSAPGS
jgi:periplasmic glucans biosynthesis protein